jgi:hypothetical protein
MFYGHDYSLYSGSPSSRTKTYALLAIASVTFVSPFHKLVFELAKKVAGEGQDLSWLAFFLGSSIAPLAVFGAIVLVFDQWVWKTKLGAAVFALSGGKQPPLLAGQYEGEVSWFIPNPRPGNANEGKFDVRVQILQTWERIVVQFHFVDTQGGKQSGSHSDMAVVHIGMDPQEVRLHYTYTYEGSDPGPSNQGVAPWVIHGTSLMTFTRKGNGWVVAGTHYSDDGGSGKVKLEQRTEPDAPADRPRE